MLDISIAICDDLEAERIGLARMVQSYARAHGVSVRLHLYPSGESLLAALRGPDPIHLLFLDIYMPGLSGVETAGASGPPATSCPSSSSPPARITGWKASRSRRATIW